MAAQHLRQRRSGAYLVQVRIPKDLRHRYPPTKSGRLRIFVERYLGTSDKAKARERAAHAVSAILRDFESLRADETATAEAAARIRLAEQYRAHAAMLADPQDGPAKIMTRIGDLDFDSEAREALKRLGLAVTNRNVDVAIQAMADGMVGARILFDRGLTPPEPRPYTLPLLPTSAEGPTITEAAQIYIDSKRLVEKTAKQIQRTARLFADHVGHDVPVGAINGRAAATFLERLAKLSPNYRRDPKAGELTLSALEQKYPAAPGEGLSPATINRHATMLRPIFDDLARREILPHDHRNPFTNKSRPAGDKAERTWQAMTDSEIVNLIEHATLSAKPCRTFRESIGWLVALAAYTGARAGELCALTADDVRKHDRIPYIVIERGKTASARRVIPLHPDLMRAGFLNYVAAAGDGPLFNVTAKRLAKSFPKFREDAGVDRERVNFHSLRKSFATSLEHADVSSDTAAMLLGHKALRSFSFSVYSPHGPTLAQLSRAVAKVRYKGLKLPPSKN